MNISAVLPVDVCMCLCIYSYTNMVANCQVICNVGDSVYNEMHHASNPKLYWVYARSVTKTWFAILFKRFDRDSTCNLRSILAQAHYTYTVRKFDGEGVPFRAHCYVPEVDPTTGIVEKTMLTCWMYVSMIYTCCNNLIRSKVITGQRIAISTREGWNKDIQLRKH